MPSTRLLALSVIIPLIAGCGTAPTVSPTAHPAGMTGSVHGGQQPVALASIQIYAVGTAGDGSASTPLLATPATSDINGNFMLTGTYTCPVANPAALVYLVATGGQPGFGAGQSNPNLALMALLGPCNSLTASTFTIMNEVTTVAAIYPLAPFMTSLSFVGSATGDAAALQSAFTTASQLANTALGTSPGANIPSGTTIPVAQINTLADILSTCVNSTGGTAGDGTLCGQLFTLTTPASAAAPTNTITALLALAKNPTLNTSSLFNLFTSTPPFQPILTVAPPSFAVQPQTAATPTLQLSASSIAFPTATVGMLSSPQPVTLQNTSAATVTLGAISLTGTNAIDFAISNGCGASLAAGASCTVQVYVTPSTPGNRAAYLSIVSATAASPQYVSLSATAAAAGGPAPTATISTSQINFTISGSTRDITLTNTGGGVLTFNGTSTLTPYYTATNTCGTGLTSGASCIISVLDRAPYPDPFNFSLIQYEYSGLTFDDQLSISLGSGTTPLTVDLVSNSLYLSVGFSNIALFPPSFPSSTFTLTYHYSTYTCPALTTTSGFTVSAPSPYLDSSNDPYVCNYTVSATSPGTGRLSLPDGTYIPITSSTFTSGTSVTLTGSNNSYTLSNYGNTNVNIQGIAASGGFTQSNNCGSVLNAQSLCTIITAAPAPIVTGGIQGLLAVVDDAGTQATQLTAYVPPVLIVPTTLVNGTSAIYSPYINVGGAFYHLTANTAPFVSGACAGDVYGCAGPFGINPTSVGTFYSTATAVETPYSGGNDTNAQYELVGAGVASGTNLFIQSAPTLVANLGSSASLPATGNGAAPQYYNVGPASLSLTGPVITGRDAASFTYVPTACTLLPPAYGNRCGLSYTFTPTHAGFADATLTFTDTLSGKTFSTLLTGFATFVIPSFTPGNLVFPNTHLNTMSSPQSIVVTSPAQHPIVATASNPQFILTKGTCAQGELPCIISFAFDPTVSGTSNTNATFALLDTVSGETANSYNNALAGTGGKGVPSLSGPIAFGTRAVGSTSLPVTETLTNIGDGYIYSTAVTLTGANASEFSLSSNGCSTLVASASCAIKITFAPTTSGSKTATLTVTTLSDGNGGPTDPPLTLTITGIAQ